MGSSSDLVDNLDFDYGLEFQDEVCRVFRSPVHHPFPSPEGSFFLLVTFRRFLFRLKEESVSLAMQSLGGRATEFHVKFLSSSHFRISVFSKQVGFHIYKLRRVITANFDCYFHLWNNGTPHWEREKHLWEIEQEKEWTMVLSKGSKKAAAKSSKRVSFDKNLVSRSPVKNPPRKEKISFGAFTVLADDSPGSLVFGNTDLHDKKDDRVLRPCMKRSSTIQDPGENPTANVVDQAHQPAQISIFKSATIGPCSICLSAGHNSRNYLGKVQC